MRIGPVPKVSEYTDNVDTLSRRSHISRVLEGLRDMISISSGLFVCSSLKKGDKLVGRGLQSREAQAFLQDAFEVGRRFKIMNPAKMRSGYGKLMYMLQDALDRATQRELGLDLYKVDPHADTRKRVHAHRERTTQTHTQSNHSRARALSHTHTI